MKEEDITVLRRPMISVLTFVARFLFLVFIFLYICIYVFEIVCSVTNLKLFDNLIWEIFALLLR